MNQSDASLEIAIGRILQLGILVSSVCLALGLALTLGRGDSPVSRRLLVTGILVLLATPAARVVISVVDYARERDWAFVVFTLIVLLELAGSVAAAWYGWNTSL